MSRGSQIVSIGTEAPSDGSTEQAETAVSHDIPASVDTDWEAPEASSPASAAPMWLAAAVAGLMIAGWTGFFAWSHLPQFTMAIAPADLSAMISAWSMPVMLVCVVWLLALRNSRREAARFGDAAQALARESSRLEERLVTTNRELSLAREFIASQSRDLESLGRVAADRISKHADRLQALILQNSAQLDGIATVSEAALNNMERLRGHLPVIASSAKDVTNNVANAGRTAHAHLLELVNGFSRLNEFGQASERQVGVIRQQVNEIQAEFGQQAEQLGVIASERFAALAHNSEEFRQQLERHEIDALAAIRTRATALVEELAQARELLDEHEAQSLTSLRARLGSVRDESGAIARNVRETEAAAVSAWEEHVARIGSSLDDMSSALASANDQLLASARARHAALLDEHTRYEAEFTARSLEFSKDLDRRRDESVEQDAAFAAQFSERLRALDHEISQRREAHLRHSEELAAHTATIAKRLEELGKQVGAVAAHGSDAERRLAAALQSLGSRFATSREALALTDKEIAALTDSSVRLLELIQAAVQHSSQDLPAAITSGTEGLQTIEGRVFALGDAVAKANQQSDQLSAYVLAADDKIRQAIDNLDELHDRIDDRAQKQVEGVRGIGAALASVSGEIDRLAARSQDELARAVTLLSTAARDAVADLETHGAQVVTSLSHKLTQDSRHAIDEVLHARAAELAGQLEQAAAHAAGVSREATLQLRDQLAKVNELTGNLERRIAQARERAEEQIDNDFARRVALITEALNSNSIDIAGAMSRDVADSAWASYLRGDRGIFTRRAVTLLESGEAKSIVQLYEADGDFAGHVNRYIHDFEAMLRQLLSTRDGHALGVTLLSSDMGKLYVALAQAIERLRA